MDKVKQGDKERVLLWLRKYAYGYRNARTRDKILPFMGSMSDRYWRLCASELIHDGQISSHSSKGYWFNSLITNDIEEIYWMKQSVLERKSRALASLADCDKQLKQIEAKEIKITQGQGNFLDNL